MLADAGPQIPFVFQADSSFFDQIQPAIVHRCGVLFKIQQSNYDNNAINLRNYLQNNYLKIYEGTGNNLR
jgi:hypothetical protein